MKNTTHQKMNDMHRPCLVNEYPCCLPETEPITTQFKAHLIVDPDKKMESLMLSRKARVF